MPKSDALPILHQILEGMSTEFQSHRNPDFIPYCAAANVLYPEKCRFPSSAPAIFPCWSAAWCHQHIPLQQTGPPASAGKRPRGPHPGPGGRGPSPAEDQLYQRPPHRKPRPAPLRERSSPLACSTVVPTISKPCFSAYASKLAC